MLIVPSLYNINFYFNLDLKSNYKQGTNYRDSIINGNEKNLIPLNNQFDLSKIKSNDLEEKKDIISSQTYNFESIQNLNAYPTKPAFSITSNSQFLANGFLGSGTNLDPYYLEHFNFAGSTGTPSISISNTDVFFEIRFNTFSTNIASSSYKPFISFVNVSNALILNNTFSKGNQAIFLDGLSSDSIFIKDNTMSMTREGIYISNTAGKIGVSNNTIQDPLNKGVTLKNVKNMTIFNNTIDKATVGVNLDGTSSTLVSISNNTITNGQNGIFISSITGFVTASNNTIKYHSGNGITFNDAKNGNFVENNLIENNQESGIEISGTFYGTFNSTISNNILTENYIYLQTSAYLGNITQREVTNNFVNGKPVDYFQFENNPTTSTNPAEIIIIHSSNVTIKDLPVISGPLIVARSLNIYISNMTVNNSYYTGMDLFWNTNITVVENSILNVWGHGIEINSAGPKVDVHLTNNLISSVGVCPRFYCNGLVLNSLSETSSIFNNTIKNFQYGIILHYSNNQTLEKNVIKNSSSDGVFIDYSENITIIDNEIDSRNSFAINFIGVSVIKTIKNNRFYNSSIKISDFFTQFEFSNNTFENKPITLLQNIQNQILTPNGTIPDVYGQLYILNSQFITLKNITSLYEIYFSNCNNVTIENSTTLINGLTFYYTSNVTVHNNTIRSINQGLQIYTTGSPYYNYLIKNNNIFGYLTTSSIGIRIAGIHQIELFNNIVHDYMTGIHINDCLNATITGNTIYSLNSGYQGIFITGINSKFANISFNTINSLYYGIYIDYQVTFNNFVSNNISNITYSAIFLEQPTDNSIINNTITNSNIGIYLNQANYNNFSGNKLKDNSQNLHFYQSKYNLLQYNRFNDSTYHNYVNTSSINNTFIGNIFSNNNYGLEIDSTSENNTFTYNIFIETLEEGLKIHSINNLVTQNDFIDNTVPSGILRHQLLINDVDNDIFKNYYSDHINYDFNWDEIADTSYSILGGTLK
jgi:parallel beta-helix repeat protein